MHFTQVARVKALLHCHYKLNVALIKGCCESEMQNDDNIPCALRCRRRNVAFRVVQEIYVYLHYNLFQEKREREV